MGNSAAVTSLLIGRPTEWQASSDAITQAWLLLVEIDGAGGVTYLHANDASVRAAVLAWLRRAANLVELMDRRPLDVAALDLLAEAIDSRDFLVLTTVDEEDRELDWFTRARSLVISCRTTQEPAHR